MRTIWVALLLAMLFLLIGCPQPIEQNESGDGLVTGETDTAPAELDITMNQPDRDGDAAAPVKDKAAPDGSAAPTRDDDETDSNEPAAGPVGLLESLAGRLTGRSADPEEPAPTDPDAGITDLPEDGNVALLEVTDEPVEVDPPDPTDPRNALDAGRTPGNATAEDQAAAFEEPPARVSRESVAFAGEWETVVINQDGEARETGGDGTEWRFNLTDEGSCSIIQNLDGEEWEQAGGWELIGTELTLNLGPGGQRIYNVDQPRDSMAILTDSATGAVLFCLRIDDAVKAPMLLKHYDSDFGSVVFRKSGQTYWKGIYGEPEGKLLVHVRGSYLVGTWEQQPGRGFVLLELKPDGFDGWWWYEASTEFDGTWRGSTAD